MTTKELKMMLDDDYDKAMNYNLVPKEWRPACYNHSYLVQGCILIPWVFNARCDQCPFKNVKPSNEVRK